jgi:carbamoyl-phosphate synthase large subunit
MLEHGHTVLIDRWDTMDQVIVAYYETMERLAASPFYFFPREFFRKLCENTAPHIHLATAYTPSHEISGGCFFSEVGGLIQYYLMGTLNAFMDVPPAKILINALRLWGIDHGHHTLNLGGGVGAKRDSLFEFKVRLSKSVATFSTVRKILLPEIYLALTHSFSWEAPDEDFFPTYRNSRYGQDVTSPASITCGVRRKSEISENPAVLEIAPAKKAPQNILITSAGRRTSLLQAFQQAARPYGSKVMAADVDPLAPCCTIADSAFKVPKLSDPSYLDALLSIVRDQEVGLIVPTIDTELSLLAKHVETFHKEGTLALISTPSFIAACGDKWNTFSIFKAEGVRMPASWIPECLPSNPPEHLFVKPRDGSSSINAYSCHRDDLAHVLSIVPNPIIQELLTGKEITMDACLDFQGTPLHYVPRERIRTLGGESIQGVTIEISGLNAWIESVLTVCGRLGAIGPITLQAFLSDTGPVLTEVNPRFGGGFPLALAAGGEYPAWILSLLHGEPVAPSLGQYRRGLYMTRHYTETFLEALPWDR